MAIGDIFYEYIKISNDSNYSIIFLNIAVLTYLMKSENRERKPFRISMSAGNFP